MALPDRETVDRELIRFLRDDWPEARQQIDRCDQRTARLERELGTVGETQREHERADNDRHVEVVMGQAAMSARLAAVERRADRTDDRLEVTGDHKVVDLQAALKERADSRRHLLTTIVAVAIALLSTGVAIATTLHR